MNKEVELEFLNDYFARYICKSYLKFVCSEIIL